MYIKPLKIHEALNLTIMTRLQKSRVIKPWMETASFMNKKASFVDSTTYSFYKWILILKSFVPAKLQPPIIIFISLLWASPQKVLWKWESCPKFLSKISLLKKIFRVSLVAQWLRICLPMQGTRVRALVWEDPTCHGATGPVCYNCWACASGACAPQQERPR